MQMSSLYVLLPDGKKDYLNEKVVAYYSLKHGMKTVAGYSIIDEAKEEASECIKSN